jgi:hypothetical protein
MSGSGRLASDDHSSVARNMSKHEMPMIRWYWQQVGGTLIEEFCAVPRSQDCSNRMIDGVIIKGRRTELIFL